MGLGYGHDTWGERLVESEDLGMPYEFQYRIECDRCHAFNGDLPNTPDFQFLCAIAGVCPGMATNLSERQVLYRTKLDKAIRNGTAKRVT